jgi:hypothetical protein
MTDPLLHLLAGAIAAAEAHNEFLRTPPDTRRSELLKAEIRGHLKANYRQFLELTSGGAEDGLVRRLVELLGEMR